MKINGCSRINLEARIINAAEHNQEIKELIKNDYEISHISHRHKIIILEKLNNKSFAIAMYEKIDKPKMYKITSVIQDVIYEEKSNTLNHYI